MIDFEKKIRKRGNKWQVTNEAGTKVLGTHDTREAAVEQLQAIEASKKRRKKGGEGVMRDMAEQIREESAVLASEGEVESKVHLSSAMDEKTAIQTVVPKSTRRRSDPYDMNARREELENE